MRLEKYPNKPTQYRNFTITVSLLLDKNVQHKTTTLIAQDIHVVVLPINLFNNDSCLTPRK